MASLLGAGWDDVKLVGVSVLVVDVCRLSVP